MVPRRAGQIHQAHPSNRYLKGALGIAALSAARSGNTYFAAKYRRITETPLRNEPVRI